MQPDIVLVAGPLVGAGSWAPTARRLRAAGVAVQVPDVVAADGSVPAWDDLPAHLQRSISLARPALLVGHSAASPLVAALATRTPAVGLVIVDGELPPRRGPVSPVNASFRQFVDKLADEQGALPPWSRWWHRGRRMSSLLGIDELAAQPEAFAAFERTLPRLTRAWFDHVIELCDWSHVPTAYIQTSPLYAESADEAERQKWPVVRLVGTHLHPTLRPEETARAILTVARELSIEPR